MLRTSFTLIAKKQLTHDVFELMYNCPDLTSESPKAGQYVIFQLAPGLNRSYSLAGYSIASGSPEFTLIIKRIPDGRGSPLICDAEVGAKFSGMIPLGHFTLKNTQTNKCFIGTGTGFAPLYCQLSETLEGGYFEDSIAFIFGVRSERDLFYRVELENMLGKIKNYDYTQYLSRPELLSPETEIIKLQTENGQQTTAKGYVTDWITEANIRNYEEFYICGSPAMVESARNKLTSLEVSKEMIFWEQY